MPGCIRASKYINGVTWSTFNVSFPKIKKFPGQMPIEKAYKDPMLITQVKKDNFKTLLKWVEEPFKSLYKNIIRTSQTERKTKEVTK